MSLINHLLPALGRAGRASSHTSLEASAAQLLSKELASQHRSDGTTAATGAWASCPEHPFHPLLALQQAESQHMGVAHKYRPTLELWNSQIVSFSMSEQLRSSYLVPNLIRGQVEEMHANWSVLDRHQGMHCFLHLRIFSVEQEACCHSEVSPFVTARCWIMHASLCWLAWRVCHLAPAHNTCCVHLNCIVHEAVVRLFCVHNRSS